MCVYVIINKRSFESFMCLDFIIVGRLRLRSRVVVIGFLCPVIHTGSPQDSQTHVISYYVISKYTFLNSSLIYISPLCQVSLQNQSLREHETYIHKHQTQIFEELVPSILPLLKST